MSYMMTNDQYLGLNKLERWYRKYTHQFIEVSGTIGTGTLDLIHEFIERAGIDNREVMYLSYDQKQVLELAAKRYHSYYINRIIYNYIREVDLDSLSVVNPKSREIRYSWKKKIKKKIDEKYKLIVVFDSVLLNYDTIVDLSTFELPVILVRDPVLLPAPDTHTFLQDANIILREVHPMYEKNPIIYFAHKVLNGERIQLGSYDSVHVIPRKQMNLFNLKSSDMNLTVTESLMNQTNQVYRERILKKRDSTNTVGERLICTETMYSQKLVNSEETRVRVYLTKGTVGTISRINRHLPSRKYVPFDFKPEFYFEPFTELDLDRHYLNDIHMNSRQIIPDEICKMRYAYALSVPMARIGHWDKITFIVDDNELGDLELQMRLMYTAISKARQSLTIII